MDLSNTNAYLAMVIATAPGRNGSRFLGPGVILKDAQNLQVIGGKNKNHPIIGIYCWVYPCMDDGPLPQMKCHSDEKKCMGFSEV